MTILASTATKRSLDVSDDDEKSSSSGSGHDGGRVGSHSGSSPPSSVSDSPPRKTVELPQPFVPPTLRDSTRECKELPEAFPTLPKNVHPRSVAEVVSCLGSPKVAQLVDALLSRIKRHQIVGSNGYGPLRS